MRVSVQNRKSDPGVSAIRYTITDSDLTNFELSTAVQQSILDTSQ